MSQAELAERIGSKQPAIARIERGRTNVSTGTLAKLAEALESTVTIRMYPIEMVDLENPSPPWWERAVADAKNERGYTINLFQQVNFHAYGVSAGEPQVQTPGGTCIVVDIEESPEAGTNQLASVG